MAYDDDYDDEFDESNTSDEDDPGFKDWIKQEKSLQGGGESVEAAPIDDSFLASGGTTPYPDFTGGDTASPSSDLWQPLNDALTGPVSGSGGGFPETTPPGPIDDPWAAENDPTTPPSTPPSTPPTGTDASGSTKKGRDWFLEWTKGKAPNKETLLANEKELNAHGYTLVPNKTLGPDGKPTNYDLMYEGRIVDVIVGGSRGGETWQYDDSGGGGGAVGGAGGGLSTAPASLQDAIARLLARGEKPVDMKDPNIAGAAAAHRAATTRGARRSRGALAERAAATGLNSGGAGSGAFDTGIQSEEESAALSNANFDSGLVLDEIKQRRGDVIAALGFAQGEERIQLQRELAMLNDQLQRAQLAQQDKQYYDRLTYDMGRDAHSQDDLLARLLASLGG